MSVYLKNKEYDSWPKDIQNFTRLMTIHCTEPGEKCQLTPLGSFTQKSLKYWSDIDINEIYAYGTKYNTVKQAAKHIQNIVKKVILLKEYGEQVYFSDFKAGHNKKGESYHWTAEEILEGENGEISLEDALLQKSVVKLDVIYYYPPRFIEESVFFVFMDDKDEYINIDADFFSKLVPSIAEDGIHYIEEGNILKGVKRSWAVARALAKRDGDESVLEKLAPILNSDISIASQILSDISTLKLMLEILPVKELPYDQINSELQGFKDKLSTITQFSLNDYVVNRIIDETFHITGKDKLNADLDNLAHYLNNKVQEQTQKVLNQVGFNPHNYLEQVIQIEEDNQIYHTN